MPALLGREPMFEPTWFDLDTMIFHADGVSYPITRFLDEEGDELPGPADATWLIAGHGDKWFTVPMRTYERVSTN